jgi:hypothetical protein
VDQLLTVRVYSSTRSRNCRGRSDGLPENVGIEDAGGRTIVFKADCSGGIVWSLVVERLEVR